MLSSSTLLVKVYDSGSHDKRLHFQLHFDRNSVAIYVYIYFRPQGMYVVGHCAILLQEKLGNPLKPKPRFKHSNTRSTLI